MSGGAGADCAGMGRPFSDVAKGMGYSGGVRRGAEMADMMSPSGQFSVVPGRSKATGSGMSGAGASGGKRPKLVKGSAEAKAYMASIRNKRGRGASGGGASGAGFFDDVLSGISKVGQVAGQVLPVAAQGLDLYNKFKGKGMSGAGQSGGRKRRGNGAGVYGMPELLGRTTQALEGRGGTDGFPSGFKDNKPLSMAGGAVPLDAQLKGILNDRTLGNGQSGGGLSGGDFWSDFGDGFMSVMKPVAQVVGAVAPFLGAGQSGGAIPDELSVSSASIPLAEAFLGGRRPQDVPRDEKLMLMKKALADYVIQKQFKKHLEAAHGRGMSGGGKLTITHGGGMSGGDEGLANSESDPLVDVDFTGAAKRRGRGMSGGALSYEGNMAMADAMGDIFSGMGNERAVGCGQSGGKRPHLVKGSAEAKAYMASIRKKKGRGLSGGGIMEPAVSAEVGQPRYSYGEMADTAGKSNVGSGGGMSGGRGKGHKLLLKPEMYGTSMTGSGLSGGDFWSDLGDVAKNLLPIVPLLL